MIRIIETTPEKLHRVGPIEYPRTQHQTPAVIVGRFVQTSVGKHTFASSAPSILPMFPKQKERHGKLRLSPNTAAPIRQRLDILFHESFSNESLRRPYWAASEVAPHVPPGRLPHRIDHTLKETLVPSLTENFAVHDRFESDNSMAPELSTMRMHPRLAMHRSKSPSFSLRRRMGVTEFVHGEIFHCRVSSLYLLVLYLRRLRGPCPHSHRSPHQKKNFRAL